MSNVEGTASTEYGHSRKHVLQYSMDGITTQFYATHLTFKNTPSTRTLTLMLCHGLAMNPEMYFPTIKYLRGLLTGSDISIGAVWLLEHANHGDSGVLNEDIIQQHFKNSFPLTRYGTAIVTFLDSGFVDHRDPNFVAIAHCGGSGGLSIERIFAGVEKRAKKGYLKRATHWSDVEEAMRYHRDKHPWDTWDPEVLELMKLSVFRREQSGKIGLKTTIEQESACFEYKYSLHAGELLASFVDRVPVHIIMAERWDQCAIALDNALRAEFSPENRKITARL
ncbi:hypothetical protein NLI96_g6992 [Meripilus lineatus]|uniref:Uncharacterized protein n=1 Tax=Meripilus lineatus TaxID=2056292 RepID=A0AAD5V076_9APHY|nr:hypothetical protein NLI96_g6992 [Physisporinus lineatus]